MAEFYHWSPDRAFNITICSELVMWTERTNATIRQREKARSKGK